MRAGAVLQHHRGEVTPDVAGDLPVREAMVRRIALRRGQPHFANARSIRNALDRARLRQANRLFTRAEGPIDAVTLSTIEAEDISVSRVFSGGLKIGAGETENDV